MNVKFVKLNDRDLEDQIIVFILTRINRVSFHISIIIT